MPPSPHPSAPTVANMHVVAHLRTATVLRELASGVDALYLSGHGYLSKGFLAQLEEERIFADRVSVPVPFELGPSLFGLAPHGWGKYRYCLDHETGRIGFTSSRRLPLGAHSAPGRVPPFGRAGRNGATFRRPGATVH